MIPIPSLNGRNQRTYQAICTHPAPHNLAWLDVLSLLRHLGTVEEEPNGNHKVVRNGHSLILHSPRTKEVHTTEEMNGLRRFLEESGTPLSEVDGGEHHLLLVIDHSEARIFHTVVKNGVPEAILPHEPHDYFRHAHNSKDFSRGQEKPDPNSFFGPVAKALEIPGKIWVFGTGTGTSSEMTQFLDWVKVHNVAVALRIIGSSVVDEHHLSEGQLLAKARDCYREPAAPVA